MARLWVGLPVWVGPLLSRGGTGGRYQGVMGAGGGRAVLRLTSGGRWRAESKEGTKSVEHLDSGWAFPFRQVYSFLNSHKKWKVIEAIFLREAVSYTVTK